MTGGLNKIDFKIITLVILYLLALTIHLCVIIYSFQMCTGVCPYFHGPALRDKIVCYFLLIFMLWCSHIKHFMLIVRKRIKEYKRWTV